ncbi:MAG: protein-L-isoaspartate O-methyltransferase [Metallosphaera sp.]
MRRADKEILSALSSEDLKHAYLKVNREEFIPEKYVSLAYDPDYIDKPIPVNDKVNTTALSLGLKMLDYLYLKGGDKVLEVGTGCGYYTAIIAEVVGYENVTTIEVDPWMANYAQNRLQKYRINVEVGDGTLGMSQKAPFNKAIFWAALPTLPCYVYQQMIDKGIILAPIGTQKGQNLYRITKGSPPKIEKLDSVIFMRAQGLCGFYD